MNAPQGHPQQYDSIIIGAGHNGLVCAAYLAKAGQNILLVEANDCLGGLAATREFHPGFKASIAHSINQFSSKIARDLDLAAHGYHPGDVMANVGLSEDGQHVGVRGGIVSGVDASDIDAFADYHRMMLRYTEAMKAFSLKTIPRIGKGSMSDMMTFAQMGLKLRLLGKEDMSELLRVISLQAKDLLDEYFDNELLKAMLSWDGLIGSKLAPRSPNHSVLQTLYRMSGDHGGDHTIGARGLIESLAAAAQAAGVEIRTNSPVKQVVVEGDENGLRATGVELVGGETITAGRVVSAADPKRTFLSLVGVNNLEIGFTNRIRRLRSDGLVAKLHVALSGQPEFNGLSRPDGRMFIAPDMDQIEWAFDDAKYGGIPENPVMELVVPTMHDASLAPEGQHVLSAHVMYVPHEFKGGWTSKAKALLQERCIEAISRYAPSIRDQILHAELLTPADIADTYHVTGGHWHHGEFALDQIMMMRPTYEAAQYSTPIPGLYLASAGAHPGGGLMGGPGHNAAKEILK